MAIVRGQLNSLSSVVNFLLTPVLAGVSDSVGRKPLIVGGALMCALSNVRTTSPSRSTL